MKGKQTFILIYVINKGLFNQKASWYCRWILNKLLCVGEGMKCVCDVCVGVCVWGGRAFKVPHLIKAA